ncbi:MAG: putative metal-binding motif-containing protein [Candidatus Woesearchaeota archaeon]
MSNTQTIDIQFSFSCPDDDSDSYFASWCGGQDVNDSDATVNPDATEVCNGIDDNLDGDVDEGFDKDGDNYTTCGSWDGSSYISPDNSYVDCDDTDAGIYPGAAETCGDGIDQDCDGNDPPKINSLDYPSGKWSGKVRISWNISDPDGINTSILMLVVRDVTIEQLKDNSVSINFSNGDSLDSISGGEVVENIKVYNSTNNQLMSKGKLLAAFNKSEGSISFDSKTLSDGDYNLIAVAMDHKGPGDNRTDTIRIDQPAPPADDDDDNDNSGGGGGPPPVLMNEPTEEEQPETEEQEQPEEEESEPETEETVTEETGMEEATGAAAGEDITGAAVGGGNESIMPAIGLGLIIFGLLGLAGMLVLWKKNR